MQLIYDSDAAYLVLNVPGICHDAQRRTPNTPILIECKTLRHVVTSAAEAEVGGMYHNARNILPIRALLEALDHPQYPTPIKSDNSTAVGFVHRNIHQKKSKSWDMRLCWLRNRELQSQFKVFGERGSKNEADYFTKHHPINYHRTIRPTYVRDIPK